ncbi:serine O-acetyltransferase [Granulicatella balaenopterae]|uniref:Serine acetyltransferase n=1 Tax=Granulicatella balaenopterae TaxID=137733 RepID=A0A1H9KB55_9LACT|nr:serine acetyltransferase [Granulicatella balaenopterae]SEQ96095.1 serine O-acetyltransferase [Granulicatella balaenopterae]
MYNQDKKRYGSGRIPYFQKLYRKTQSANNKFLKMFYKVIFTLAKRKKFIELSADTVIGEGLYFGHAYCITINPNAKLGKNINLHKGVTIGQENRGKRKGAPTIGDEVWIGINSTIVGNVTIGNNVLIAPNTYVNCDIPDNSIVFGNPCIIKRSQNATEDYINRKV